MSTNGEAPRCLDCNQLTRYILKQKKYWCANCAKFLEQTETDLETKIEESDTLIEENKSDVNINLDSSKDIEQKNTFKCPKCNTALRMIEQYERYWCDECQEYMPKNFTGADKPISEEIIITEKIPPTSQEILDIPKEDQADITDIEGENFEREVSVEKTIEEEISGEDIYEEAENEKIDEMEKDNEAETSDILTCPRCGDKIRFLEQYNRYWCDKCADYIPTDFSDKQSTEKIEKQFQESKEKTKKKLLCPTCGKEVRFMEQYDRYWCDKCTDYMSSDFGYEGEIMSESDSVEEQLDELDREIGTLDNEKSFKKIKDENFLTDKESDQIVEDDYLKGEEKSKKILEIKKTEEPIPEIEESTKVESFKEDASELEPEIKVKKTCPQCDGEIRYVEQFDRYWCDKCAEYMPVDFGKDKELPAIDAIEEKTESIESKEEKFIQTGEEQYQQLQEEVSEKIPESFDEEFSTAPPTKEEKFIRTGEEQYQQLQEEISEKIPESFDEIEKEVFTDTLTEELKDQIDESVETSQEEIAQEIPDNFDEIEDEVFTEPLTEELKDQIDENIETAQEEIAQEMPDNFDEIEDEVFTDTLTEKLKDQTDENIETAQEEIAQEIPDNFDEIEDEVFTEPLTEELKDQIDESIETAQEKETSELSKLSQSEKDNEVIEDFTKEALICPDCSEELRYVEQYNRFWCDKCSKYMAHDFGKSETSSEEDEEFPSEASSESVESEEITTVEKSCPKCKSALRYVEQYDRFWCDECSEYMPQDFTDSKPASEVKITDFMDDSKKQLFCPKCNEELVFSEQYNRFWCENCNEYMPLDFGEEKIEITPSDILGEKEEKEEKDIENSEYVEKSSSESNIIQDYIHQEEVEISPDITVSEKERFCNTCGKTVRYVEQYNRYWCDNCSEYIPTDYEKEETVKSLPSCPKCGKDLIICQPSNHLWCSDCDITYKESDIKS